MSVDLSRSESILVRGHILAGGPAPALFQTIHPPCVASGRLVQCRPRGDRMARPSSCRNKEAGSTVPVGFSKQRSTSVETMFAQKLRLRTEPPEVLGFMMAPVGLRLRLSDRI